MTQRILPNIVSGGMCCYSQFAFSRYSPEQQKQKTFIINKMNKSDHTITLISINKTTVINLFYGDNLDKFSCVNKINKDDLSGN
jgi:predicted secreted acid phosphatase